MRSKLRLVRNEPEFVAEASPSFQWRPLWQDRKAILFVSAWALLLVLFSPARVTDIDVSIRAAVGHSLWTRASTFIERGSDVDAGLVWITPNQGTSFYGIGQSLALIPFDMVGSLAGLFSTDAHSTALIRQLAISLLYVPLIGALWLYALWTWLQCWGLNRKEAALAATAYFFASPALFYSAQSAQEEALVSTLGLTALIFAKLASEVDFKSPRALIFCGFFAGLTLLVRLNAVFFLLPILGLVFDGYRRNREAFVKNLPLIRYVVLGAAVPALMHMLFALLRFGSALASGYNQARSLGIGVIWASFQWDIAVGFLFGLGKGLFILAPAFFMAFWGARAAFQKHRFFGWSIALTVIASCIFHGHILNNPDGSECWSVRYLLHLSTLWVLPTWFGFQRARQHELWKAIAYSSLAIGVFFACLSLVAPNALEYTQSAAEQKLPKTLLLSWSDGQLARRATNLSLKLSGENLEESVTDPRWKASIAALSNQYLPNIWPWVLSKKFPQHALWVWMAWMGALALSAHLFWRLKSLSLSPQPRIRSV